MNSGKFDSVKGSCFVVGLKEPWRHLWTTPNLSNQISNINRQKPIRPYSIRLKTILTSSTKVPSRYWLSKCRQIYFLQFLNILTQTIFRKEIEQRNLNYAFMHIEIHLMQSRFMLPTAHYDHISKLLFYKLLTIKYINHRLMWSKMHCPNVITYLYSLVSFVSRIQSQPCLK